MKKLHAVALGLVLVGIGTTAMADACKAPKVKVVNDKAQTIKVTKIQYFDGCNNKWRTEDVAMKELAHGASFTFTDTLEYVEGCKVTKFKLYRAVRQTTGAAYGAYAWGGELVPDQGPNVTCVTNAAYTIHAHD